MKITADPPITTDGITVITISRIATYNRLIRNSPSFFYLRQPVNVVTVTLSGKQAFQITGEEISLEGLIEEIPDLEEMLG